VYSKYNIKIKVTTYLKPSHVSGISSVFQTVLIAFQEKLQEKSIKQNVSFRISCVVVITIINNNKMSVILLLRVG